MTDPQRYSLARRLFQQWTGLTHPELLGAVWNALSREDRQVWLDRADRELSPQSSRAR